MVRVALLSSFVLALVSCTAGQGHPCQEQNDCSDGLICCKASASLAARGTCESECSLTPTEDAGEEDAADATTDAVSDTASDAASDAATDTASDAAADAGDA